MRRSYRLDVIIPTIHHTYIHTYIYIYIYACVSLDTCEPAREQESEASKSARSERARAGERGSLLKTGVFMIHPKGVFMIRPFTIGGA